MRETEIEREREITLLIPEGKLFCHSRKSRHQITKILQNLTRSSSETDMREHPSKCSFIQFLNYRGFDQAPDDQAPDSSLTQSWVVSEWTNYLQIHLIRIVEKYAQAFTDFTSSEC